MNASSGSPFPELLDCGASNDVPNLKEEKFVEEGQEEEEEGSPERNNKHGDSEEEIHKNLETTSEEDQLQHIETPLNPSSSASSLPNFPFFSSLVFQDFPPNISLWRKLESSSASSSFSSFPSSDSFENREGCCWKNVNALLTRLFAICVCLNNQSQQPCDLETPNPVGVPTIEEQAFVPTQENTYTDYSVDNPINGFGSVEEQVSQRNTLLVEEEEAHDRTVSIPAAEDVHERENKKQLSSAPKNPVDQPSLRRISVPVPLCEDGQHSATPNLNNIPPKDSVVGEASGFLNLTHQPSNVSDEIPKPAEMVHCKRLNYCDNNDFKLIYRPKQRPAFRTDSEWNRATFEELKNVKDINFASMVEQYRNRFFYYKPLYDDHQLRTRAVIFPRLEQNRIMDCLGTILSIELFPDKEEQKSSLEKE